MPGSAHGLRRLLFALMGITACVLAAALLHIIVGSWGRDPRPAASFMALLLALLALYLAGWRGHRLGELFAALALVEGIFVLAIGFFAYGGLPRVDDFFSSWFIPGNLYIALPWLAGMAAGAYLSSKLK